MNSQSNAAIQLLDESNFAHNVLEGQLPVVVTFRAEWSAQSKSMEAPFAMLAQQLEGKAKFFMVDVDRAQALVAQMRIQSVPMTLVFLGGQLADAKPGPLSQQQLLAMVEPFFPKAQGAIPPQDAAELQKQGKIVFVDTRDEATFKRTHLPGAVNMPMDGLEQRLAELHMLPGAAVLYCRGGKDSQQLSEKLTQQGFSIPFLEGGILAWEVEGLPIERG